jgi:hypothetical protein
MRDSDSYSARNASALDVCGIRQLDAIWSNWSWGRGIESRGRSAPGPTHLQADKVRAFHRFVAATMRLTGLPPAVAAAAADSVLQATPLRSSKLNLSLQLNRTCRRGNSVGRLEWLDMQLVLHFFSFLY